MSLFRSKFAKLEALAAAKPEERTPEMLEAAQAELDTHTAGVILVPKTDTIKTGADLQNHIDGLEKKAKDADAAKVKAEADMKAAQDELAQLKAKVPNTGADTPVTGGDAPVSGDETAEQKEAKTLKAEVAALPHNEEARRLLQA